MKKRVTLFSGHYGSGKTNIAVNYALMLANEKKRVQIADLDIVNPYFRTKDSEELLNKHGIRVISSQYANTNLDVPALPQEMYSITCEKDCTFVVDVGGDDRGALALGRLSPELLAENDFEMVFVANFCRPLTRTVQDALEIMREIELAGGLPFTAIANNTNLGDETTKDVIMDSVAIVKELSEKSKLPIIMTAVKSGMEKELENEIPDLFPLKLQEKYY